MKQLRESDIHGAPLPFQAAASSSITCFKIVCDTIRKRLGSSELRQQLKVRSQTPCGLFSVSFARIFFFNTQKSRAGSNTACHHALCVRLFGRPQT